MNEIDRREREGRVAARDSANRVVVMLTLAAIVGVIGFSLRARSPEARRR